MSLLCAGTEWIEAFGASTLLVGRSHECDHPESIQHLPVLTGTTVPSGNSKTIDDAVRTRLEQGLSLYDVDVAQLDELKPDLIVTQTQCDVCAVSMSTLQAEITQQLGSEPDVFSLDPRTFKDVLAQALQLGRRIGRPREAMTFIAEREKRLRLLREAVGVDRRTPDDERPTVACIEWLEPLMISGNWVPDLVSLAGGRAVCASAGEPSEEVGWQDVLDANPDVLAVMACGFSIDRTWKDIAYLTSRPGWADLAAVREGRVFIFDGRTYFNRPGPRLYRSVELMASALHGHRAGIETESWEMKRVRTESQPAG